MNTNSTSFAVASAGTFQVNDTTAVTTKKFNGFEVSATTVVSELKVNGNATNVIADYISTPATAFDKTTLITAQGDDYFSHIKLSTAGSATLILR